MSPCWTLSALFAALVLFPLAACSSDDESDADDGGGSNSGNVTFAATCSLPSQCGGDAMGRWELVDACVRTPPEGYPCENGARSGSGTASGGFDWYGGTVGLQLDTEVQACGQRHEEASGLGGTSVTVSGNTLTFPVNNEMWTFCADGDSLWLASATKVFPELTLLHFRRSPAMAP